MKYEYKTFKDWGRDIASFVRAIRSAHGLSSGTKRKIVWKSFLQWAYLMLAFAGGFALLIGFFPIKESVEYGFWGGILHGTMLPGNLFLKAFWWKRLLFAPHHTAAYCYSYYYCLGMYIVFIVFYNALQTLAHHCKREVAKARMLKEEAETGPVEEWTPTEAGSVDQETLDEKLNRLAHPDFKTEINKRKVKIFVSSTFQDLQKERDHLMTQTFPKMSGVARERKVSLIPVDLRWGVTEQEAHTGKVVEYCLKEIDNSVPFFIGIVGERYGWCPGEEELQKNKALGERYRWIGDDFHKGLSVTEIEIQYGVLRRQDRMDAAFYFTGTDEVEDEMLKDSRVYRLREKIAIDERFPVHYFSTVEELGEKVEKDLTTFLDKYFPKETLTGAARYRHEQLMRTLALRDCYIERPEQQQALDTFARDGDRWVLVVDGAAGSGRTTLLANWCATKGEEVMLHIASYCNGCYTLLDDLKECRQADNEDKGMKILVMARRNEVEEGDIDTLVQIAEKTGTKFILSGHVSATEAENCPAGAQILHLPYPDRELRSQYIDRYLEPFGKKLSDEQKARLLDAPALHNMLTLKTVLDELVVFGKFEQLDSRIEYYTGATDETEVMDRYLTSLEQRYGRRKIDKMMSRMALSRKGLDPTWLDEDVPTRAIHGVEVVEGRMAVGNEILLKAIEKRYLTDEKKRRRIQKMLRFFAVDDD